MLFQKGKQKTAGRVKGTPNKSTAEIKNMIMQALDKAGGAEYLYQQAKDNPNAFLKLVGQILPKDVNLGNQEDNKFEIHITGLNAKD